MDGMREPNINIEQDSISGQYYIANKTRKLCSYMQFKLYRVFACEKIMNDVNGVNYYRLQQRYSITSACLDKVYVHLLK